jgi:hypothetical protein
MERPKMRRLAVGTLALIAMAHAAVAQANPFEGVNDPDALSKRIVAEFQKTKTPLAFTRNPCSSDGWRHLGWITVWALDATEQFQGDMRDQLRLQVASNAFGIAELATRRSCHEQAQEVYLRVVMNFRKPEDAYLRERARIGLDDLRHQQLLDAIGRR